MSVYIKGMEMPTGCDTCPFEVFGDCHGGRVKRIMDIDEEIARGVRHKNCPLIPVLDHGRLIDADALVDKHFNKAYLAKAMIASKDEMGTALVNIPLVINNAPTIIPADKEKTNEN